MKHAAFAVALCLMFNLSTQAQSKTTDSAAIQATVTNYIEGYYAGDAARMQATLHPHYLKHMIHGNIPMREWNGQQMVESVRSNGPADMPASEKTEQVSVMDISGDMASAKLVTPHWTDYMTLAKVNGSWKILSVVQRIED
ncbi:MAG TPA: nuclear transport factor 2 family protein [Terriglobales bacterium]|nr:nuclear transport factor 2 family protein [Terriglobales bacterium]